MAKGLDCKSDWLLLVIMNSLIFSFYNVAFIYICRRCQNRGIGVLYRLELYFPLPKWRRCTLPVGQEVSCRAAAATTTTTLQSTRAYVLYHLGRGGAF